AVAVAQRARLRQVVQWQWPAVPGVLQAEQPGAREMRVHRLDRAFDDIERQRAVPGLRDRLRLDRAEYRGAAALVLVGVRVHADDVLVAARAMRHQRDQVRLRAAGKEQARLEPEVRRQPRLQGVDRGIVAIDVV